MSQPLAVDLYCGLGGWTEGLLAEGWRVIGYDIERHEYGELRYPGELILRDVRTLHGSELAAADLIVGSSPCQEFSYRAMPWKRAKALGLPVLGMELFHAQFRLQREASEAAGRHIPMVVENVRGAQPWVGRAAWHYGSYYLWGDVPALMPMEKAIKNRGGSWFAVANNTASGHGKNARDQAQADAGVKGFTVDRLGENRVGRMHASGSKARKAASALIAKIPLPLSQHIARVYYPRNNRSQGDSL